MTDLGTYSRFKDWLIAGLVAVVFSLLGLVVNDNRGRLERVETSVHERGPLLESFGARLTGLEVTMSAQREEISRRLGHIEDKIDKLGPER